MFEYLSKLCGLGFTLCVCVCVCVCVCARARACVCFGSLCEWTSFLIRANLCDKPSFHVIFC
jgi:hypothetical protein